MAQEPAPVVPLMNPTQVAHQNNRDKAIRRNNCTFLLRIHLLAPLPNILTINAEGVYSIPAVHDVNDLRRFSAFLTDDVKVMCQGRGLRCVAFEPNGHYTSVTVQDDGSGYDLVVPWRIMLHRCEVEDMGVLSMWGFYENGRPIFIFRLDGYARLGEELPPLTDMTVVDPEPAQDNQIMNNEEGGQQHVQIMNNEEGGQQHVQEGGNSSPRLIMNKDQEGGRRNCCNVG